MGLSFTDTTGHAIPLGLAEANAELSRLVDSEINAAGFRDGMRGAPRRELFDLHEAPAARKLPQVLPEFRNFTPAARVGRDYLVRVGGCRYSVPWRLAGRFVSAEWTAGKSHEPRPIISRGSTADPSKIDRNSQGSQGRRRSQQPRPDLPRRTTANSKILERCSMRNDRVSILPNHLSILPDRFFKLPDHLSILPDRFSKLPDHSSILPDRFSQSL